MKKYVRKMLFLLILSSFFVSNVKASLYYTDFVDNQEFWDKIDECTIDLGILGTYKIIDILGLSRPADGAKIFDNTYAIAVAKLKYPLDPYQDKNERDIPTIIILNKNTGTLLYNWCEEVGIEGIAEYRFHYYSEYSCNDHGWFNNPQGITMSSDGNVYVSDTGNNRIVKLNIGFDPMINKVKITYAFQNQNAGYGSGNGQFKYPEQVALDRWGNVYVADTGNHRIQVFDKNLNYKCQFGNFGSGDGQFNSPKGVAVQIGVDGGTWDSVYVADTGNNRIQRFRIQKIGNSLTFAHAKTVYMDNRMEVIPYYSHLDTDIWGNVYVTDPQNKMIYKFNEFLDYIDCTSGKPNSPFAGLNGITIEKSYTDDGTNRDYRGYNSDRAVSVENGRLIFYEIGMDIIDLKVNTNKIDGKSTIDFICTHNGKYSVKIWDGSTLIKTIVPDNTDVYYPHKITHIWNGIDDNGVLVLPKTYTLEIKATDIYGNKTVTRYWPIDAIGDTTEPSKPSPIYPLNTEINTTRPKFRWTGSIDTGEGITGTGISHYEIELTSKEPTEQNKKEPFINPAGAILVEDFDDGDYTGWTFNNPGGSGQGYVSNKEFYLYPPPYNESSANSPTSAMYATHLYRDIGVKDIEMTVKITPLETGKIWSGMGIFVHGKGYDYNKWCLCYRFQGDGNPKLGLFRNGQVLAGQKRI